MNPRMKKKENKKKKQGEDQGSKGILSPTHSPSLLLSSHPPTPIFWALDLEPDSTPTPWVGVGTPPRGGVGGVVGLGCVGLILDSISNDFQDLKQP